MFDIKEFYKARAKLFENQSKIHTLYDLRTYLKDIDLVCINEKSSDLTDLILALIEVAKQFKDYQALFELYKQYFFQTYYYVQEMNKTEKIVHEMRSIAERTKSTNQLSIVYLAESLVKQLKNEKEEAIILLDESSKLIENLENDYQSTYYRILYSHTYFTFREYHNYSDAIDSMEKCLDYYSQSNNMRGLILSIHQLLKFYTYARNEKKVEDLLLWIFNNNQVQDNLLYNHFILLNWYIGISFTIRNKLDYAIEYLEKAYSKVNEQNLQTNMMYEYTDIIRFLSRCYAYQGKFQQSYDLLVELVNFMEHDYVSTNYYQRGKRYISISSYYTLLFIFVQLDLDVDTITDKGLKKVFEYTKSILNSSIISNEIILTTFSDDKNIIDIIQNQKAANEDEISIALHQLLLTHTPYQNPERNINKIQAIRHFSIDPLYADVLLAKILISMGKHDKFKELVKEIDEKTTDTKTPILKIWRDFFILLSKYIDNLNSKETTTNLEELADLCRNNNFIRMEEEIRLYHRLIASTNTINKFTEKIRQTAFMDIYDKQSKDMVLEYLEEKNFTK